MDLDGVNPQFRSTIDHIPADALRPVWTDLG